MAVITITAAKYIRSGVTREVFLTRNYAIKIPKLIYGWRNFLCGLLANMQESEFSKAQFVELCPVVFSLRGGWLVVMRRAEFLTDEEWLQFDAEAFYNTDNYKIPAENKKDSFGWYNGRIVAIDYGN